MFDFPVYGTIFLIVNVSLTLVFAGRFTTLALKKMLPPWNQLGKPNETEKHRGIYFCMKRVSITNDPVVL